MVLLNSGAALFTSDVADSIAQGMELAAESIDSGKAQGKLNLLIQVTNSS